MLIVQAMIIGILITCPTGFAILFCSRGNAVDRREIYRLTQEIERLEQRHRTDLHSTMTIYADHEAQIAILEERHEAELERLGAANLKEFSRGVEWERQRPEREAKRAAQEARWLERRNAELQKQAEEWRS